MAFVVRLLLVIFSAQLIACGALHAESVEEATRCGAVAICVGIDFSALSSMTRLPDHAARSIV